MNRLSQLTGNIPLRHPLLINRESERDIDQDHNRMQFLIPVHAPNVGSVTGSLSRRLSFVITLGDEILWSENEDVILSDPATPSADGSVSISDVSFANGGGVADGVTPEVVAGDAAIFRVKVSCPSGWSDLTTVVTGSSVNGMKFIFTQVISGSSGIYAVGARVVSTGLVSYVPPEWTVTSVDDNVATVKYAFQTFSNSKRIAQLWPGQECGFGWRSHRAHAGDHFRH